MNRKKYYIIIVAIFIMAIFLRLLLAFINVQSNDDHFAVIDSILTNRSFPTEKDCLECYHPKFYYYTASEIIKVLGVTNNELRLIIAQELNAIAGVAALVVFLFFINKIGINQINKLIIFGLVAFNPDFLGINVQATNDTFVILFSSLALFFCYLFLKRNDNKFFVLVVIFSIIAGLSKGNGLVAFVIIFVALLIKIFIENKKFNKQKLFLIFIVFIFCYMLIVPYFGQYVQKYYSQNSFFYIPLEKPLDPSEISDNTKWMMRLDRPGVTSIINSYLTFRIIDLLINPKILSQTEINPIHKTSLWTQLYGRSNFVHFPSWPPTWETNDKFTLNLGRVIFVLALLPLSFFIMGLCINIKQLVKSLLGKDLTYYNSFDWFFILGLISYLSFIVYFTYIYRDFSVMKAVYLYPGLIIYIKFFYEGFNTVIKKFRNKEKIVYGLYTLLVMLSVTYILDVVILTKDLLF